MTGAIHHTTKHLTAYPEWLSYDALSEWLGIPKPTLYSKVSRKEIPHHRISRRLVRFRRAEIETWLQAREVRSQPSGTAGVFLDVEGEGQATKGQGSC